VVLKCPTNEVRAPNGFKFTKGVVGSRG